MARVIAANARIMDPLRMVQYMPIVLYCAPYIRGDEVQYKEYPNDELFYDGALYSLREPLVGSEVEMLSLLCHLPVDVRAMIEYEEHRVGGVRYICYSLRSRMARANATTTSPLTEVLRMMLLQ